MFKYRNRKTGAVIEVPSKIGGGVWEQISGDKTEKETVTAVVPAVEAEEDIKPVKKARKTATKTTKATKK